MSGNSIMLKEEDRTNIQESRLGTEPVPSLLLKTTIPMIFSLLANSLYNVVDSIFVSHIEEDALTALSLSSPVQMLMGALGCGIAVGLNAAISKALGENNRKKLKDTAAAAIFLAVGAWILIALLCVFFVKPYFEWQSGGNSRIYQYGIKYLRICMLLSLGVMGQWVFDRFLIAAGKSRLFLLTLASASIVNLILDPIFIFGYFGLPRMETTGAALATVIGQFSGCALGIVINGKYNKEIPLSYQLKPDMNRVKEILRVGVPTFIMQGMYSVTSVAMNTILQEFSTTAVAVLGICNRVQGIACIGIHGTNNGLVTIVAYNYGARKPERIKDSIRWAMLYALCFTGISFLIIECFPEAILYVFDASEGLMMIGIPAVRIFAFCYLLSAVSLVLSASFQGFGNGKYSMYLNLTRQVILPLGFVVLLSHFRYINLIWCAYLLAEIIAIPFAVFLYRKIQKGSIMEMYS